MELQGGLFIWGLVLFGRVFFFAGMEGLVVEFLNRTDRLVGGNPYCSIVPAIPTATGAIYFAMPDSRATVVLCHSPG